MSKQKEAHLKNEIKRLRQEVQRGVSARNELTFTMHKAYNFTNNDPVIYLRNIRKWYFDEKEKADHYKREYKTAARLAWSFGILCIVLLAALVFSK